MSKPLFAIAVLLGTLGCKHEKPAEIKISPRRAISLSNGKVNVAVMCPGGMSIYADDEEYHAIDQALNSYCGPQKEFEKGSFAPRFVIYSTPLELVDGYTPKYTLFGDYFYVRPINDRPSIVEDYMLPDIIWQGGGMNQWPY